MNLPTINCTTSVCSTRRKREAERSVNWTAEETHVLLCAWSDQRVQKSLSESLRNRHIFKHLSARMSDMGFSRSPHQCRLRVKTLKANYARAKLQRSSDSSQMCTFKYFDEMDAVLGRPASDSSRGDPRFRAAVAELGDHELREHLSSSSEKGSRRPPWPSYFHVKMENGDDSEFSDAGFQESPQERQQDLDVGATVLPPPAAPPVEVASSPPPATVVANPADDGAGAAGRHPDDVRLEPALQHLAHCYQQLLSETRALLAQLEKQRQEQASWHQELLSQWLQRQREAAEREERREKAHMEHQIQVLELLTCLVREQDDNNNNNNMPQTPHSAGGYNKNFYQAKEELYSGLYYHDNNLASGSLEALIRHLLPTVDYYPDRTYIFTFLLSSRLFIHPYELMSKVCHLCVEQQRLGDPQAEKIRLRKIAPKILQLLTEWTETFPYDFRDDRMMRSLKDLTHRLSTGDEIYRKAASQLSQGLIRRLTVLSQYEEALVKINATVAERLTVLKAKARVHRDILSICNDPFTLAQQLTHIELERLSYIGPEEFVQAFVQKDPVDNDKGHFSDRKKAANLEAYVDWFNRLSYLVATEICMPMKKKQRARVVEFFIDVARECFNIGNFNSLMAIISGMNMSPVSRLRKTWSKVKTAKFDILEHQMDPSGNFYNYRTALRGATQRSVTANSSREKMVIPFFSLLIKDIYFLNESCANRLHNGHINFQKLWELAKQVSEFMSWKAVQCPFDKDRKILHYLLTAPVYSEDALCLASYESEGPDNNIDKDRWKSLRSTLLHRT